MAASKKEFNSQTWRPSLVGRHYAASTGHYLATFAAQRILERGGNAVDAGVCAAMALAVLQPDVVSFAGVAPTLIFVAEESRVVSLAGLGYWPAATNIERLVEVGGDAVPEGILRTVVPAAPATHVKALRDWGTISFEEAVLPAYELARDGFAMYPLLHHNISYFRDKIARYPENRGIFLPGEDVPPLGSLFRQRNLATTMEWMIEAERRQPGDRRAKLDAVHDCFYRGRIADRIAAFHAAQRGFMTKEDLAGFSVPEEPGITCRYRDHIVHACDVWCQGIALLQALKIVEGMDVKALGVNSTPYVHAVASALNLAFADREAYVGDPRFVDVPKDVMVSEAYAANQRRRIDPVRAFSAMPAAGVISGRSPGDMHLTSPTGAPIPPSPDTIYASVVDRQGNAYSATLSDTSYDGPMVEGLGLSVSTRGSQSRLEQDHPNAVRPGKRPRLTPSPVMVLRDGKFEMALGTPGGDIQVQAMLQVMLNVLEFGMPIQHAIENPRFGTFNFPNSFSPYEYRPGRLCVEDRIADGVVGDLARMGYDVERWNALASLAGGVCSIVRDGDTGLLHAGADPRREAYAVVW